MITMMMQSKYKATSCDVSTSKCLIAVSFFARPFVKRVFLNIVRIIDIVLRFEKQVLSTYVYMGYSQFKIK